MRVMLNDMQADSSSQHHPGKSRATASASRQVPTARFPGPDHQAAEAAASRAAAAACSSSAIRVAAAAAASSAVCTDSDFGSARGFLLFTLLGGIAEEASCVLRLLPCTRASYDGLPWVLLGSKLDPKAAMLLQPLAYAPEGGRLLHKEATSALTASSWLAIASMSSR